MQTKFLHKIKWYKPFLVFCVLVIQTLFINQVFAQEVQVNLKHPPYNQLKVEHLWNLTLTYTPQDTAQEILSVYLYGTLTESTAGLIATGTSTTIQLSPGVKTFTAANYQELDPQIDYRSSDPKYEESVMRTGGLPDGDYEACVYVRLVSDNNNIGDDCIQQIIELMPAPSLTLPDDGDTLMNKRPVFTWMQPVTPGTDVNYKIKIVEIWYPQSAEIAIENNPAWFEEDNIPTTVFLYPASAMEFLDTITYAWQITSFGPTGEPIGENNGESEVWRFITGKEIIIPDDTTKGLIPIDILLPAEGDTTISTQPTFEWVPEKSLPSDATYDLKVVVLREGQEPEFALENNAAFFEIKNVNATRVRYQEGNGHIDHGKTYICGVSAYNSKNVLIAKSSYRLFSLGSSSCSLISPSAYSEYYICQNTNITIDAEMPGTNPEFGWRIINDFFPPPDHKIFGQSSVSGPNQLAVINIGPFTDCGKFDFVLLVDRHGPCPPIYTDITVYVYPNVGTATISVDPVCSGRDDAELTLVGIDPDNAPVDWDYEDNPFGGWNDIDWGHGISINTNIIEADACAPPGLNQVIRTYRATVDLTYWGLPEPPPGLCPNVATVDVTVDCPTRAGNILVTTTSGHFIDNNNKICSDKDGDGLPDYPVELTVILKPPPVTVGNEVWSPSGFGLPGPYTPPITLAGPYTFKVIVQNGSCDPITRTRTITVVDPPPTPEIAVIMIEDIAVSPPGSCPFEVCPHDDAVLGVNDWSSMPTGTKYEWYYAENTNLPMTIPPAGPWTFAGEGYEQNTNEIGPSTENWTNVWWIVTAQDEDGVCDPVLSAGCEIIVIKPPCAPILSIFSPNPKCPGDPVELNAAFQTGCGTIVSYQWYRNGKEYSTQAPPIQVTKPGSYYLVVQGECESAQSKTIEVIDHEVEVTITGECCSEGNDITLTASGTSTCPPGTGTYSWSGGLGSDPTITVNPAATTTYTVTFTDACGCKATTQFTITVCY